MSDAEPFSLRRIAREVVEDWEVWKDAPMDVRMNVVTDAIIGRIDERDVWVALRQAITPLVERAFEEHASLYADRSPASAPPSASNPLTSFYPSSSSSLVNPTARHVQPPAPPRLRRSKAALVRTYANAWLSEQSLQTSSGRRPLGACTFEDLMDAVGQRRRKAYASMAQADVLERLANLLRTHDAVTVADLPSDPLAVFMDSNPQVC